VRFRNTINVTASNGRAVPLHVSNYAVLVTDVPDLLAEEDGGEAERQRLLGAAAHCAV